MEKGKEGNRNDAQCGKREGKRRRREKEQDVEKIEPHSVVKREKKRLVEYIKEVKRERAD